MNYSKKAQEIRQAMKPVRIQAGKWLLLHLNRAWSKGESAFIPAGTYWMTGPIILPPGAEAYSMKDTMIVSDMDPQGPIFQVGV